MKTEMITYDVTKAAIAELKAKYPVVAEIKNNAELKEVKSAIADVRKRRTAIEARRKELKADALKFGRAVDAKAKELTALILEIEEPLKAVVAEYEDRKLQEQLAKERAEQERIEKINALFNQFNSPLTPISTVEEIEAHIEQLSSIEMGSQWGERIDEAIMRQRMAIEQAKIQLQQRKEFEEAQAILEAERAKIAEAQAEIKAKEEAEKARALAEEQQAIVEAPEVKQEPLEPIATSNPALTDDEIFAKALNDATAILRQAQDEILDVSLKANLDAFISVLEETQINSRAA